jgi:phosphotriesterase-related protein
LGGRVRLSVRGLSQHPLSVSNAILGSLSGVIVRTVLGDIDPGALGPTYMHEHLIIDSPMVEDRLPEIHLPSVNEASAEVERLRQAGLGAAVDAMPGAAGRDVVRLAQVSERTGVHIVAATGLHTTRYYPDFDLAVEVSEESLAELFTAEIEDGADGAEHRTGVIKVATLGDITGRDRRVFAAAAEAHLRTGAPILTHCEAGLGGVEQVELLSDLGVALDRVALSHTDKVLDIAYHRDLLASGVNVVYDQALRQPSQEEKGTAWLLAEMIDAGHGDRLMLGTDGARRSMWATLGGSPGLDWLLTEFTTALEGRGIDRAMRSRLFVTNPARFLSFDPPRAS